MCLKQGIILHKYFLNYDYDGKLCTYGGTSQCELKFNNNNQCFVHFSSYVSTSLHKAIGIKFVGNRGGMLCTLMLKKYYCCDVGSWKTKFHRDHIELSRATSTKQVNNIQYSSFLRNIDLKNQRRS